MGRKKGRENILEGLKPSAFSKGTCFPVPCPRARTRMQPQPQKVTNPEESSGEVVTIPQGPRSRCYNQTSSDSNTGGPDHTWRLHSTPRPPQQAGRELATPASCLGGKAGSVQDTGHSAQRARTTGLWVKLARSLHTDCGTLGVSPADCMITYKGLTPRPGPQGGFLGSYHHRYPTSQGPWKFRQASITRGRQPGLSPRLTELSP